MKKIFFLLCLAVAFSVGGFPVNAVICNPVLKDCTNVESPKTYTNNVLSGIFTMFFIVGILYFLWHGVFAGLHLMGSEGDPKRFEQSKNELTYSLTGLVLIFGIYGILKVVGMVFGIQGLETFQIQWPSF